MASAADLRAPINRWGGNATSRYNWQINATNRAADWYFESIASGSATPADDSDTFVSQTKAGGAEPVLTIPVMGWVASTGLDRVRQASFSIAKYGAQTAADSQWFSDAGNGVSASTGQPILGNDPTDANVSVDSAFQQGWIQHLVTRWGTAPNGGVRYYALDNEPSIWYVTHRDVHPTGATMDEVVNDAVTHASRIKAVDPSPGHRPRRVGMVRLFLQRLRPAVGATHGWSNLPRSKPRTPAGITCRVFDQLYRHDIATGSGLLDIPDILLSAGRPVQR